MKKLVIFSALALALALSPGCAQEKPAAKPPVIMSTPPAEQTAPTVPREKLANKVDPICDMHLEENVRFTSKHVGKEYGFCSSYCVEAFQKDPKKFIDKLNALPKQ